jgi:photosystem II stability/assembly factor-like uncharacterized protein
MKQQLNLLTTTVLVIVVLVLAACTNNRTTALPAPQPSTVSREIAFSNPVALAYHPADNSLLKADSEGVFRWQTGRGWEQMIEAQNPGLSGIAINPDQPAMMYLSGPGLGVLRSDDGGDNWQEINAGLPGLDVTALAMHSFRRDTLYAWLINDGIYRTEDGGVSWKKMPDVPIEDPPVSGLTHSTLEGSMNTGWLYAATPSGAFLSMD